MSAYRYEALDDTGKTRKGVINADSEKTARAQLRAQALMPVHVEAIPSESSVRQSFGPGPRIAARDLCLVTRQLAMLLSAGMPLEQAFTALIAEVERPVTREVLSAVKSDINAGVSLAVSLGAFPGSFPPFYRALVQGAEQSGALPSVLTQLADHLDARQDLKDKTTLSLLYPGIVLGVALIVITGLMIYVVPQVTQVFEHSHQRLPWLTRALIWISGFLQSAWPYLAALIAALIVVLRLGLKKEYWRKRWHAALLRLPGIGRLVKSVIASRFAGTLSIQLMGGVALMPALASSVQITENLIVHRAIEQVIARVREGVGFAKALGAVGLFPPMFLQLIASGEASGELAEMLGRAAALERQAIERRLGLCATVLEPVMILIIGGIVLLIVLAVLMPIIEMNQLVR